MVKSIKREVAYAVKVKYSFDTQVYIYTTKAFFIVSTRYALVDRKTPTARFNKYKYHFKKFITIIFAESLG